MGSQLRVASGQLKGTLLDTPAQATTHPMGAREKLALFNMLRAQLSGATVLDLYAGTGALGIEALSNGAAVAVFVEQDPKATRVLASNLALVAQRLDPTVSYELVRGSVERFLASPQQQFDLILADPPYDYFQPAVFQNIVHFLRPGGTFALSFPNSSSAPELPGLQLITERSYARAGIAIYRKTMV